MMDDTSSLPDSVPQNDLTLSGSIANHIFGASHGSGPLPIEATPEDAAKSLKIDIPFLSTLPASTDGGKGVHVFILDTVPQNWESLRADFPINTSACTDESDTADCLLRKVLNLNSEFITEIEFSQEEEDKQVPPALNGTRFDDHGLAIGGIIRSIAPEVSLYFVRVLNDYGVGSLASVQKGLDKVSEIIEKCHLQNVILNMSFEFGLAPQEEFRELASRLQSNYSPDREIPFDDTSEGTDDGLKDIRASLKNLGLHYEDTTTVRDAYAELTETAENMSDVEKAFNHLATTAAREGAIPDLIAASGNYDKETASQASPGLWARFPANDPLVIGVGAVPKNASMSPASYSLIPDLTSWQGIYTLGGDINAENKTDPSGFILGLTSNPPFVRWWAGTSFAAAIVTGTLAQYKSKGGHFSAFVASLDRNTASSAFGYLAAEQNLL
jgi:Subtilase family